MGHHETVSLRVTTGPSALEATSARADGRAFLAQPDWFACLVRSGMSAAIRPRVYALGTGAEAAFLAAWTDAEARRLTGLTTYYSLAFPFSSPYGAPDPDVDRFPTIAAYIAAERPRWRRLTFSHASAHEAETLTTHLKVQGYVARREPHTVVWWTSTAGRSYTDYLDDLPGQLRNTLVRRERRALRAGLTYELHQTAPPPVLRSYQDVYAASWKPSEAYPGFIPDLCATAAQHGALRLGLVFDGETPIAAQIWLLSGHTAHIYKLAQADAADTYSAGTLLTAWMLRDVGFSDNVDTVTFGTGDEPYKAMWMTHRDVLYAVEAGPETSITGLKLRGAPLKRLIAARLRRTLGRIDR